MVIHRETSRQSDESPGVGWFPKSGQTPTFPSLGLRVLRGRQWGWSGEGSCDAPRRHYKTSAAIYRPCRPQRALGLAVPPSLPPSPCLALAGGGKSRRAGEGQESSGVPKCGTPEHSGISAPPLLRSAGRFHPNKLISAHCLFGLVFFSLFFFFFISSSLLGFLSLFASFLPLAPDFAQFHFPVPAKGMERRTSLLSRAQFPQLPLSPSPSKPSPLFCPSFTISDLLTTVPITGPAHSSTSHLIHHLFCAHIPPGPRPSVLIHMHQPHVPLIIF